MLYYTILITLTHGRITVLFYSVGLVLINRGKIVRKCVDEGRLQKQKFEHSAVLFSY